MKPTSLLPATLLAAGIALAVHAADAPLRSTGLPTRVLHADAGRAFTLPSNAAPAAVVAGYLRAQGRSDPTVRSLRVRGQSAQTNKGVRFLRLGQEVGGLPVYDTYAKAAINARGQLVSLVENLAPVPAKGVSAASIDETIALGAAIRALKIPAQATRAVTRSGTSTRFARGNGFVEGPLVTRVAVPMADGTMQVGFLVQTWRTSGNRLVETLVGGDGRVVETVSRTNSDSYNVFAVDPEKTKQKVVTGGAGWLFAGAHRSIDIGGNNVHAYLDAVNDSVPDPGGTTITNGNFLSTFDPTVQPSTDTNRNVAVQNLFYLNNVIHDRLYAAGFNEIAGNFQEDNGGAGGRGSDSVNAEAQDGGGTDNANFATPRDGQNPRMQMYLWSSPDPDHEVVVPNVGTFGARRAEFSPVITATGFTDDVALVNDGVAGTGGGTINDGCEPFSGVSGQIALLDRGFCNFTVKVQNAQAAGAVGVIVANNQGDDPIVMGGTPTTTITIPAVMIGQSDGATLKGALPTTATVHLIDPPLIRRDGDLDSDIVWHEYGHGLTWRMIGRMDGPMSGAIGEGMSDVLSVIVNDDDVVAEYSAGTSLGLRSEPYANYSRTYSDVTGSEVHFDGELYGAIGWRLWKNLSARPLRDSADAVLGYLVNGMNYTQAHPTFENMRDGILAGLAGDQARQCLVWEAFAHYGVGVGASGAVQGSRVVVNESFARPAQCQ
jgi:extracellular elastinolytic metalloproteinase